MAILSEATRNDTPHIHHHESFLEGTRKRLVTAVIFLTFYPILCFFYYVARVVMEGSLATKWAWLTPEFAVASILAFLFWSYMVAYIDHVVSERHSRARTVDGKFAQGPASRSA